MAGRFLMQKFSSQMSRSRSLFAAYPSAAASARARALASAPSEGSFRTLSNLSRGAAVHLGTVVPNNGGIHACEGSIRTLSNRFHGAAVHPSMVVPKYYGIRGDVAKYFNTSPSCSRAVINTRCPTTVMPSIIITRVKPAFVDSVRGAKRAFSSEASARHEISREAKMATWAAEWDAKSAAWQARCAAWEAEIESRTADFNKFMRKQMWLWGFTCFCWSFGAFLEEEHGTSCYSGQSGSSCCNCKRGVSNS